MEGKPVNPKVKSGKQPTFSSLSKSFKLPPSTSGPQGTKPTGSTPAKKSKVLNQVRKLEEEERARRLTSLSTNNAQLEKIHAFLADLEQERKERVERFSFTRNLEEEERARKLTFIILTYSNKKLEQKNFLLEQQRSGMRIGGWKKTLPTKYEQTRKESLETVIAAEENERKRRIAEEHSVDDTERERRADDKAYTIIAEEKERERRISEEAYLNEVEEERRADDKAYTIVAEEEERARRIAEESYLNEVQEKDKISQSKKDLEKVKNLEEEERARKITNLEKKKREEMNLRRPSATSTSEEKRKF